MDWGLILGTGATVISAIVAVLSYRMFHGQTKRGDVTEHIDRRVAQAIDSLKAQSLEPLKDRIATVDGKVDNMPVTFKLLLAEALEPIREDQAVTRSKLLMMDTFWKQVAVDLANILHHPQPEREEFDRLLEKFKLAIQENRSTLTPDEELELQRFLDIVRNYEPGDNVGFPVYDGEQLSAALLLRIMHQDLDERQRHERGRRWRREREG